MSVITFRAPEDTGSRRGVDMARGVLNELAKGTARPRCAVIPVRATAVASTPLDGQPTGTASALRKSDYALTLAPEPTPEPLVAPTVRTGGAWAHAGAVSVGKRIR